MRFQDWANIKFAIFWKQPFDGEPHHDIVARINDRLDSNTTIANSDWFEIDERLKSRFDLVFVDEAHQFFDPATIDVNTVKDWTGCLQLFFGPGFKALAQDAHPKSKEVDLLDDDHSDPNSHSEDDPSKLSYLTSSGIDYQKVMGYLDRYVTDPTDLQDELRPFFEILVVRFQNLHVAKS
ncbi:hypothetical protein KCU71_g501, partial [Aureobasidium melanogenum]